jgi:hypothetical protein
MATNPKIEIPLRDLMASSKNNAELVIVLCDMGLQALAERDAAREELAKLRAAPYAAMIRQQEARIAELENQLRLANIDQCNAEAELAPFRELAREAHATFNRPGAYISPEDSGFMERLAALHKEE